MMMILLQLDDAENGHHIMSDESSPEEVDPKLLRKQLLEVSAVLGFPYQQLSVSFC